MRNAFLIILFLLSFRCSGQLIADPALEQVTFTDLAGNAIDDTMPLGYIAQLNVPIKNLDAGNGVPAGSCKIKIGLGTKMLLAPSFDLSTVVSSEYFQWTEAFVSGQIQLTGELIAPLPPNYSAIAKFNVQGSVLEYSTITTNFLITNHNTLVILSDQDPSNNTSFRRYKIIPPIPIPVNIYNLSAINNNCSLIISFNAENEINVSHFDIETSKDGISFTKAVSLLAANRLRYDHKVNITQSLSSATLFVRIKSVDRDGTVKYSNTKTVNTLCNVQNPTHFVYPNPVNDQEYVTVKISEGIFNGSYKVQLYDAKGSLVSNKRYEFYNQQQFDYPLRSIASGNYTLVLISNTNKVVTLVIQKQ